VVGNSSPAMKLCALSMHDDDATAERIWLMSLSPCNYWVCNKSLASAVYMASEPGTIPCVLSHINNVSKGHLLVAMLPVPGIFAWTLDYIAT
jgi:hypothetical protein